MTCGVGFRAGKKCTLETKTVHIFECLSPVASYRQSPPHVDPRDEAGDGELPVVPLPLRVPPPDESARVPRAEVAGERGAMVWLHADHVQVGLHQRGRYHNGGLGMRAGSIRVGGQRNNGKYW